MDRRHRKKAITGVLLWLAMMPAALLFCLVGYLIFDDSPSQRECFFDFTFLMGLVAQTAVFFWAGSHLAKAKGHSRGLLICGIFCWLAQPITLALLLFVMRDRFSDSSRPVHKKKHQRNESPISRIVRYRRNALVANVLGVVGILAAVVMMYFPLGIFENRENEKIAALILFLPSYAAVLYGCWWWVKAKHWPDAVIFIGLMPLAPFALPYVRIFRYLYFKSGVMPSLMVLMPILLIAVVATLPDKSGMPKRKRWDRD